MPSFDVAHVREQGQNVLLFPLNSGIHHKTDREKAEILAELEARANAAGLAGTAAIVWEFGRRTHTYGPRNWQGFLSSLTMTAVLQSVNQQIRW